MSFASVCKDEICEVKTDRKCCAVAESYGVLLFCHSFAPTGIRITTASAEFALRLPKLFKKAFGITFDVLPSAETEGKRSLLIKDPAKIEQIFRSFDLEAASSVSHHINFGVIEEECCRASFVRGAFLAGGTVTDPEKRYHLELSTGHHSVARETYTVLLEMGFSPKESSRAGNSLIYFKQSEAIADFLTTVGASTAAMNVMTAKVEKEMRNTITRQINCDSANADKTVAAAQQQLRAIKAYVAKYGLDSLPEALKDAALLRITNPEASLSDLARLSYPEVSKSCLSHRLRKITELAEKEEI